MSSVITPEIVPSIPIPSFAPKLTLKQKLFIRYYLETGNGADSARRAGYSGDAQTLSTTAYELIRHPYISLEIKRLCDPIADAQEVLQRLTAYSRASIADVLTDSGEFDLETAKGKGSDGLIKKLKFDKDTGRVTDLEIHDAKHATEILAKVHGLTNDKQQDVSLTDAQVAQVGEQVINALLEAASRKRLEARTVTPEQPAG